MAGLMDTLKGKTENLIDRYEQENQLIKQGKRPEQSPTFQVLDAIKSGGEMAVEDAGNIVGNAAENIYEGSKRAFSTLGKNIESAAESAGKFIKENPTFLMGATPVLMGLLTGDPEAGYAMASKTLFDEAKRRNELDIKRNELLLKQKSQTPNYQMKQVYDKDTKQMVNVNYDPAGRIFDFEGKPLDPNRYIAKMPLEQELATKRQSSIQEYRAKGQNYEYRKDDDGSLYQIDKLNKEAPRLVFNPTGLTPVQKISAEKKAEKYNQLVVKDIDNLRDFQSSWKDLLSNNQLANKTAVLRFVKEIEDRLSDQDKAYYTAEISAAKETRAKINEYESNKLNPRLIKDALGLASRTFDKIKNRMSDKRKLFKSQLKGVHKNIDDKTLESVFGEMPQFESGVWMYDPVKKTKDKVDWADVDYFLQKGFQVLK